MTTIEKLHKFTAVFVPLIMTMAGGASTATAATETVVYSFAGVTTDGANPYAALVFDSSGNLWGTPLNGGASGKGIIFEITSP